ncbi:uncharacterized protein LAESUDRAFT_757443 [Laetiporus sulphureus 93-53]|uniref:Uncharacterized protein n=1 Tax=Laetiporus sulphureus 93-53 TaxID=1314785 RepID=A0A165FBS0_9APHY|nr:uncharacterized protein LAESUDRAFT_757443 [Laetiporus sulphureus 93-53]KZT08729.1 hypothetical protein LAESUDRAFT_757443 [Laetiporus sulphureus 93-53]
MMTADATTLSPFPSTLRCWIQACRWLQDGIDGNPAAPGMSTPYFLLNSFFSGLPDIMRLPDALLWPDDMSAANIWWLSRGDWWNDENACGAAGAVPKKLDMGDEGDEVLHDDMV